MASLPPDQSALERHVLYILLDSNLPTGGFVASSGLESYAKHGFFSPSHLSSFSDAQGSARTGVGIQEAVVAFAQSSVMNYAKSTLAFVKDAWTLLDRLQTVEAGEPSKEAAVVTLKKLDDLYEAMTLNHVTRRSSTAQGIALLTLLTKGFAPPNLNFPARSTKANVTEEGGEEDEQLWWKSSVDTFKRMIRRGEAHGHLPVCWGVLTRAMGLSLERSLHLHLFLHVRSLLSSAVRLNLIGPYASTQLLLHSLQPCIELETRRNLETSSGVELPFSPYEEQSTPNGSENAEAAQADNSQQNPNTIPIPTDWDWAEDVQEGPAVTWPLGELLMCRHDMQHTRIFNS